MTFASSRAQLLIGILLLPAGEVCVGETFDPKLDNRIICLDIHSGKVLWEHTPDVLSDAHFEWYRDTIVAYPNYDGSDRSNPIFLDSKTGKAAKPVERDSQKLFAKSAVFWPQPDIQLDNGWRLTGFSPGNTKSLEFQNALKEETWRIETGGYPHQVRSWKNLVFYAFSYLSDEGVLYACRAGEKDPVWTIDLNTIVDGRSRPLTRMIFQVIEDQIYLEANEHIFCINPESGMVVWHRDLAKDLELKFRPDFYGGALNLAVFAKSREVLVIAFECRVVALDLTTGQYLWHLHPDTFPHCPFPVVHENRVVLTAGAKRILTRLRKEDN